MSDRLKSRLAFTNVAAGGQAVLAHGLHVGPHALAVIPSEVKLGNSGFSFVSADATNVTVQNDGALVASCVVLCEYWHTIERAFGDVNVLALASPPFVAGQGVGGGGSAPVWNMVTPGASPYAAAFGDFVCVPSAPWVVTLPALAAPATDGQTVVVKLNATDPDTVTVNPSGGNTIDGAVTFLFADAAGRGAVLFTAFGTAWMVN